MQVTKLIVAKLALLASVMAWGLLQAAPASAADILCEDPLENHMLVSDATVSACLDAGLGNLNGNPASDLFLTGVGTGYTLISKSDEANPYNIFYDDSTVPGSFSFDAAAWGAWSSIAIGFKFGTGGTPDEWFVYSLVPGVSSGDYTFVNVLAPGGTVDRLSHVNLYGKRGAAPEPGTVALLGIALAGLAVMRRRRIV